MQKRTLYLEDIHIEVFRSHFGLEKVVVNGELVSKKRIWFSTVHEFQVEKEGVTYEFEVLTRSGHQNFLVDIYRDDQPLLESYYDYDRPSVWAFVIIMTILLLYFYSPY